MKLLIMRHGEATPPVDQDATRALTTRGHAQARSAAEAILQRITVNGGEHPQILLASPYLRAQETAREVRSYMPGVEIETTQLLLPEGSLTKLIDYLAQRGETSVMLVSHQPLVSLLIEQLTGEHVSMGTANAALIETEFFAAQQGELKWFV